MPYQGFNYAAIQPTIYEPNVNEAFKSILQGMEIGHKPGQLARKAEEERYANIMKRAEAEHAPENERFKMLLNKAKGENAEAMGAAELAEKQAHAKYWEQGGGARGGRGALPMIQKLQDGLANAVEEFGENSPQANEYRLAIQKHTTDAKTRNQALLANNVIMSMNSSDIDALTRYSGAKGAVALKAEQLKDLTSGKPSEEYRKHLEAKAAINLEAKQLRQSLGDSITPGAAQALHDIVDATSFGKSPEAAKAQILAARKILKRELENLQKGLISTEPYQGNGAPASNENSQANQFGEMIGNDPLGLL